MRIVKLIAENFKKVKAIEIVPGDDGMVILTGRNEQGKTSVLDAIAVALGGADVLKTIKEPIRQGCDRATIIADLGDMVVTRTFTEKGTYLTVKTPDGKAEFKTPQQLLDGMIGRLSFDPLAFSGMKDKDQLEALLSLVKIDLDLNAHALERQRLYDERTIINRDVKQLEGQIAGIAPQPEETPDIERNSAEVLEEMRKAQNVNSDNDKQRRRLDEMRIEANHLSGKILDSNNEIEKLEAEIERLKGCISDEQIKKINCQQDLDKLTDDGKILREQVESLKDLDLTVYDQQMAELDGTNRSVRLKQQRNALVILHSDTKKKADGLTDSITALDDKKDNALKAAQFPIDGLGFNDIGVTYKNIPFAQCSAAERLRVSLAMAMALNPKLRVIRITDGSLLDSRNMAIIKEMVAANDFQVWIEVVDESGKVGIFIEDGEVVEAEANL